MDLDESILASIKQMLGIIDEVKAFDDEITAHINSTFINLRQLQAIDPKSTFSIHGYSETWRDLGDDVRLIDPIRSYIYLNVRLLFDPPASSTISEAYRQRLAEIEWRMNVEAETLAAQAEEGAAG